MREVKIEITGHGRGKVFIDGQELTGACALGFEMRAGEANVVKVEIYAKRLEVVHSPTPDGEGNTVESTSVDATAREFTIAKNHA